MPTSIFPRLCSIHPQDTPPNNFTRICFQRLTKPLRTSVSVAPECVTKFNELKLGKSIKYIIYKLSDDYKQIVVEESGSDSDWEHFQNKLLHAKSPHKGKEGKGPRYAVYDFQYELEGGEGTRYAITIRKLLSGGKAIADNKGLQEQDCLYFVESR